ncbi:hypothetical protein [Enterococcus alishanensis]|uniref:Peptidase C39-like domain-containing protein n=1 Tax=Enterococcus alishanensis TaxID=1303817 RepID=A0ABS6T8J3_9ENTE|nr:hypothetical protein [Enterococcus alishanensis]MBV7389223.1 hypothetical protein [Enterococcus alishanensis]
MYPKNQWIELNAFSFYKNWQTPSGFLCGTYASSVLLAYYQDVLAKPTIPVTTRQPFENQKKLIDILQPILQPIDLPTVPLQISFGLNWYFHKYQLPFRARSTSIGSWQRVTKRILAGEPVMIGLAKYFGSTYGNHWVVVHGFYESNDGQRYYKIHDNWGATEKIIPARWGNGTISLQEIKTK